MNRPGYYSVRIHDGEHVFVHTIFARSDYEAAVKIRKDIGIMEKNEHDVSFVAPHADEGSCNSMH
jgi:hypothetical protein